jgi:cytochrome c-type biogenesis protein CcmH/NrfG
LYVIAVGLSPRDAGAQPTGSVPSPDALYAAREDLAQARRAAQIWAQRLAGNGADLEAAWKLSRAYYWLGTHGPADGRRADLEAGVEAARTAIRLAPKKPEGHFWLAANMGALAESFGLRQGIKYRRAIREALEEVLRLDPAFQQGSADRALGRWYFLVPGLFGGSNKQSEAHLRASLAHNPQSTLSWYFLAETLLDMGRRAEARQALQRVIDAPLDPEWAPEDKEWKAKARAMLARTQ